MHQSFTARLGTSTLATYYWCGLKLVAAVVIGLVISSSGLEVELRSSSTGSSS